MQTYQIATAWKYGSQGTTEFTARNDEDAIAGFGRWVNMIVGKFPRKLSSANLSESLTGPIDADGNITSRLGREIATTIAEPNVGVVGIFDIRKPEFDPAETLDSATFVNA